MKQWLIKPNISHTLASGLSCADLLSPFPLPRPSFPLGFFTSSFALDLNLHHCYGLSYWGGEGVRKKNSFRRTENHLLAKESIPEWVLLQLMYITQSSIHVSHQTHESHIQAQLYNRSQKWYQLASRSQQASRGYKQSISNYPHLSVSVIIY